MKLEHQNLLRCIYFTDKEKELIVISELITAGSLREYSSLFVNNLKISQKAEPSQTDSHQKLVQKDPCGRGLSPQAWNHARETHLRVNLHKQQHRRNQDRRHRCPSNPLLQ